MQTRYDSPYVTDEDADDIFHVIDFLEEVFDNRNKNLDEAFKDICNDHCLIDRFSDDYDGMVGGCEFNDKEDYKFLGYEPITKREAFNILFVKKCESILLYLNYCLKWLMKIGKKKDWENYKKDYNDFIDYRRKVIEMFYTIDPQEYLEFLEVEPDTTQFPLWDPLEKVDHSPKERVTITLNHSVITKDFHMETI